jgi:hypothetical protein
MYRYLTAATLLALAAPVLAAPIHYDGWADNIAQVDSANGSTTLDYLPVRVNIRGDDATGHIEFIQWDVYSDDRTKLAYSLPPQSVDMDFGTKGWGGYLDTPDGDWRVILWPRYTIQGNDWRLQVHLDLPLQGSYFPSRPNVTSARLVVNILQIPEPASWLLLLGWAVPFLVRRLVG